MYLQGEIPGSLTTHLGDYEDQKNTTDNLEEQNHKRNDTISIILIDDKQFHLPLTQDYLQGLKRPELISLCRYFGFKASGKNVELIDRLLEAMMPKEDSSDEQRDQVIAVSVSQGRNLYPAIPMNYSQPYERRLSLLSSPAQRIPISNLEKSSLSPLRTGLVHEFSLLTNNNSTNTPSKAKLECNRNSLFASPSVLPTSNKSKQSTPVVSEPASSGMQLDSPILQRIIQLSTPKHLASNKENIVEAESANLNNNVKLNTMPQLTHDLAKMRQQSIQERIAKLAQPRKVHQQPPIRTISITNPIQRSTTVRHYDPKASLASEQKRHLGYKPYTGPVRTTQPVKPIQKQHK